MAQVPVIEDADSLRAVRGNGVMLLRDDEPLSARSTTYMLQDASGIPPALASATSKYGLIFMASPTGGFYLVSKKRMVACLTCASFVRPRRHG